MKFFAPVLALAAAQVNAQAVTDPTAAAACITKLETGVTAATASCGLKVNYIQFNQTYSVSNDAAAYTTYLDKICSPACVNAIGNTIKNSQTECKAYPYGSSTLANWTAIAYEATFKFSCLKQGGEYCLVKQIKAAQAAGKVHPSMEMFFGAGNGRSDLCMPCLKDQTDLVAGVATTQLQVTGQTQANIDMTVTLMRGLYNSCPANTLTGSEAITTAQLVDMKSSPANKFALSGLVAAILAATLLA
jgi:hypothetical protein